MPSRKRKQKSSLGQFFYGLRYRIGEYALRSFVAALPWIPYRRSSSSRIFGLGWLSVVFGNTALGWEKTSPWPWVNPSGIQWNGRRWFGAHGKTFPAECSRPPPSCTFRKRELFLRWRWKERTI